jgi:hypothetical protein
MTNTTARCDHIVALIDACLAEVEASALPAAVTALFSDRLNDDRGQRHGLGRTSGECVSEVELGRQTDQFDLRADAQFGVGVGQVSLDRPLANEQTLSDLLG